MKVISETHLTKVVPLKPNKFLSLSCILKPIKCNESNMIGFSCIVMPMIIHKIQSGKK
jgi:hypothetical protein